MIIPVRTENGAYDIILESGVLGQAGEYLDLRRKTLILTDDGVPHQYAETIERQSAKPYIFRTKHGESAKCIRVWEEILNTMMNAGFTRGDCLVSVGGGVIGDLGGFAASCYMRGIDFYNIPTTLLSQTDSSIGGKTAVNLHGMKNIIGSFYPPKRVLIDPETLKTLDDRQKAAGMAEVIKMAATCDADLFGMLEKPEGQDITEVIRRALEIKKQVVEEDPREQGIRKVLNFGHTIGHAIENAEEGRLLHGECVALGMIPMSSGDARKRIRNLLERHGLPVRYEKAGEGLLTAILHDKKAGKNGIAAVTVEKIGTYAFGKVSAEDLCKASEVLK